MSNCKSFPLEEVATVVNGFSFKSQDFSADNDMQSIKITNVGVQEFIRETDNFLPRSYKDKYSNYSVGTGDVVIALTRTLISSGLKVAIVPDCFDGALVNQRVAAIKTDSSVLNKMFLYYYLTSKSAYDYVKNSVNELMQPNLSIKDLKSFSVPCPLLPEQKRIVAILDQAFADIDKARANAEQNLKNARELFESYLQQVFSQRGEGWCNEQLGNLLVEKPRNGWSPPAKNHSDNGVPVLTLSSVTGFEFNIEKIKFTSAPTKLDAHYWVENGDLLITRSNTPELVGHVAICSNICVPTIYPDLIMKLKLDSKKVTGRFVYYQLRSDKLRKIITCSAQGANPTMKKINQGIVQGLPITYPCLDTQNEIVKGLDSIYEASLDLEKQYRKKLVGLNELKKSILQKAFSGELTKDDKQGAVA